MNRCWQACIDIVKNISRCAGQSCRRGLWTWGPGDCGILSSPPNRPSKCHPPQLLQPPCLRQPLPPVPCLLHPPCFPPPRHLPFTHLPLHANPSLRTQHRPHLLGILAPCPQAAPSLASPSPLVGRPPSPSLSLAPRFLPPLLLHSVFLRCNITQACPALPRCVLNTTTTTHPATALTSAESWAART